MIVILNVRLGCSRMFENTLYIAFEPPRKLPRNVDSTAHTSRPRAPVSRQWTTLAEQACLLSDVYKDYSATGDQGIKGRNFGYACMLLLLLRLTTTRSVRFVVYQSHHYDTASRTHLLFIMLAGCKAPLLCQISGRRSLKGTRHLSSSSP